eukprot:COSAG02_NODE_53522_length_301_cov_0.767327_1_plen_34_part_01
MATCAGIPEAGGNSRAACSDGFTLVDNSAAGLSD